FGFDEGADRLDDHFLFFAQSEIHAHPYNPVYLLPLVEIVGGEKTSAATIKAAMERLTPIGMKGVHIAKEIEAFVGDRLLEALW
ncbi:3-hydroxyacyl-CoA dehydrogenase NAD-binding domain-containing protein, partial [Rhizobium ruizarguesonis]